MMKENTQLAQTGLKITTAALRCSICRDKGANNREAINRALSKGFSHKDIEAMTGIASRTIGNHAAHLPDIYREARETGILKQAIDVYTELREQLTFAKDLREAARAYLSDPATGALTLLPRSSEITVVYDDYADTNAQGEPKKKRDSLDHLLCLASAAKIEAVQTIMRHVDIRLFALDAIKVADLVIDKFAKIEGSYQKDNEQKRSPTHPTPNDHAIALIPQIFRTLPELTPGMVLDALIRVVEGVDEKVIEAEVIRYVNERET